jgi:two-component system, LytTR family, sensor kinase
MSLLKNIVVKHYKKVVAVTLLWVAAIAYLLVAMGFPLKDALLQSFSLQSFVLFGFWMLSNIFSYYSPRSKDFWVILLFPLFLSLLLAGLNTFFNQYVNPYSYFESTDTDAVYIITVIYFLLFFVFWSVLLVFSKNIVDQRYLAEKEEKHQKIAKEAELHYLKQQLQPHFLFNSLNSINALIGYNPEKAREMVVQLAEFLRATIRQNGSKWVTIEEEIDQLQLFLQIEKVRFGERLQFHIEIEDSVMGLNIPQLLIQPLLENSIKHGLYGHIAQVVISLCITSEGKDCKILLSNPYDPTSVQAKGSGFGLEAVKRRLVLLFGRTDLLEIEKDGQMFNVQLKIPQMI